MQQPPYGNYPYYGQPMYPQTPYMAGPGAPGPSNGYPAFYGPPTVIPQPPPPPPSSKVPAPYGFDVDAYALKHDTSANAQARRQQRSQSVQYSAAPLKSAMKKTMTAFTSAEQSIGRQFSNPFHQHPHHHHQQQQQHHHHQQQQQQQSQAPPFPRPRVQSNPGRPREGPHAEPAYHMLLSFHNYNELHLEHIMPMGLEEMRQKVWPCWPDGIESENVSGHNCVIKFRNTPWDLNGPNVGNTYKMIVAIFTVFQEGGYSFQTAINIATSVGPIGRILRSIIQDTFQSPRLLFQVTEPVKVTFFVAFFSSDGRKFTMYRPPEDIEFSIGARLRSVLPFNSVVDNVVEDSNSRVIEVRRKISQGTDIDASTIFIEILKILADLNFQLDATLPLGRKNGLGIRSIRELLIFKYIPRTRRQDLNHFMS